MIKSAEVINKLFGAEREGHYSILSKEQSLIERLLSLNHIIHHRFDDRYHYHMKHITLCEEYIRIILNKKALGSDYKVLDFAESDDRVEEYIFTHMSLLHDIFKFKGRDFDVIFKIGRAHV